MSKYPFIYQKENDSRCVQIAVSNALIWQGKPIPPNIDELVRFRLNLDSVILGELGVHLSRLFNVVETGLYPDDKKDLEFYLISGQFAAILITGGESDWHAYFLFYDRGSFVTVNEEIGWTVTYPNLDFLDFAEETIFYIIPKDNKDFLKNI